MAQQEWFVIRNGKETGPLSPQQLKKMASSGDLTTEDAIRRSDKKDAVKAGTIKGLFATVNSASSNPPPVPPQTEAAKTTNQSAKRFFLIAGLVGGACMFLCCGGLGIATFFAGQAAEETRQELAEADALWENGDQAGGAAKYRSILDNRGISFVDDEDKANLYGRLIDFEFENNHPDAGKSLIEKATERGIMPTVSHADANAVVATIQEARARAEALAAEKLKLAQAEKKEQERLANLTPQERLKEATAADLVDSTYLVREFRGNEVAAEEKYQGKVIMVFGKVGKVEKGFSANTIILSRLPGDPPEVYCTLSGGNTKELAELIPGELIHVQGRCDGKFLSGAIGMSDCIFVRRSD